MALGLPSEICKIVAAGTDGVAAAQKQSDALVAAWKVKRLYYTADVNNIWRGTMAILTDTVAQCDKGLAAWSYETEGLQKQKELCQRLAKQGLQFNEAWVKATANNVRVIDAPELKEWSLTVAREAVQMQWWLYYTKCNQPAIYVVWNALVSAVTTLIHIVVAIVEAVVVVGEAVITAISWTVRALTYSKWTLLIGGTLAAGLYAYRKVGHARALAPGGG